MTVDFDNLRQAIEIATKTAFAEMVATHGPEEICAFALYSDEGAMTVCPATNTRQHLATAAPAYFAESQFEPAEWAYEMDGAEVLFNAICATLRNRSLDPDDASAFVNFRRQVFQICIDVLEKLKQENFFRELSGNDILLQFSVSDADFDPEEQKAVVTKLNDNAYRDTYIEWLETMAD